MIKEMELQSKSVGIESLYLLDKRIEHCKSCYKCSELNKCIIEDDVEEMVDKMKKADAIIYVPVIYAFSSGSIFQSFLERAGFGYLRLQDRPLRNKFATVIVIGRRYAHSLVATQVIMNIY